MKKFFVVTVLCGFFGSAAIADELVYGYIESNDLVARRCGPTVAVRLDNGVLACLPSWMLGSVNPGERHQFNVSFASDARRVQVLSLEQ